VLAVVLKLLGGLILAGVVFIVAGVTGFLFVIWPTFWPDQTLRITPDQIAGLQALRAVPKFYPDEAKYYPGSTTEERRVVSEALVNAMLDSLVNGLALQPRKSFVLRHFKSTMRAFPEGDSEDTDRLCRYLVEVMDALAIDGSNELLNVWRYGFPYGWVLRSA
jgi:hypothetical protein